LRHAEALAAPERAHLLKLHAAECNTTNRIDSSLESANRALRLYREMGECAAQAKALMLLSRGYWKLGKGDLAQRHIADAIALLENGPESRDLAMAYSMHSQLAMSDQRTDEALH
jgi:hypothetical protein